MRLGLEKKNVLVTGGTKGIGRAIVKGFLAEGAHVHFCARTEANVTAANNQLAKDYPNAKAVGTALDISNPEALKSWITSTAEANGGMIDVLVANVSALAIQDGEESWRAAFETDLLALYTLTSTAEPYLLASAAASNQNRSRHPNIITISSVSGRDIDFTAPSPYGPVKAAVIHYTASLARKLAPKGVRANCVSPGNIYIEDGVWGGVEKGMPELFKEQWGKNPMGRMGRAEEIADVVLFAASERAGFMSGSNLTVDGALCNGVQF